MEKLPKDPDSSKRHFRVLHQLLSIPHIDFGKKLVVGYTELQIKLLNHEQRTISLNCKQCKIFRVTVNGSTEADFNLVDPSMDICQHDTKKKLRTLDHFSSSNAKIVKSVDSDFGSGELLITLPDRYEASTPLPSTSATTRSHANDIITLAIEFTLENPASGLHFVIPPVVGMTADGREKSFAERGAYLISGSHANSSRLWFPCVESYSEIIPWNLEITVDKDMIAVTTGTFAEAVPTPDKKFKTFHYVMNVPVCSQQIGLAVGPFEMLTDPKRNEVVHFCLPKLLPLMRHATSFVHQAFEFCEEHLSFDYPYPIYKQVFVDHPFEDLISYATMTVLSCSYLFPKSVIEQNIPSRSLMALGVCRQFFGCYLSPSSWSDMWIANGICRYLHGLYYKKYFGQNEQRYQVYQQMKEVVNFEQNYHPITLVPPRTSTIAESDLHFSSKYPATCSEKYVQVSSVKAHLVVRMLEERIGGQMLAQVFNKMLSLASNAATAKECEAWNGLLMRTDDFVKAITALTTKEIQPFIDKWVLAGGHLRLKGRCVFNRKTKAMEMELTQEVGTKGGLGYSGPFPVAFQGLDGATKHVVQLEENITKYEVACHSKTTRRYKKKKIPLWTGEEIDIDLNEADADSPVLWIRFDTDFTVIRSIAVEQPDYQLQYILKHERDIVAQLSALENLEAFMTPATKVALTTVLDNDKCFYRIRLAAAEALARLSNYLLFNGTPWSAPPPMYALYKKLFFVRLPSNMVAGAPIPSNIVKRNNFHDFIKYFLQKNLPVYMARLRNPNNVCPTEIVQLLLDMWKFNENRMNFYTDSYYRAALIEAFAETFTESAGTLSMSDDPKVQFEQLGTFSKHCMENVFRALNEEKFVPSYQYVVTISCLNAFQKMHRHGILPVDWCVKVFKDYTDVRLFRSVRAAAFGHLVDHLQATAKVSPQFDLLDFLLTAAEKDPDSTVRHTILRRLIENPPFTKETAKAEDCALSTESLVERLWVWMNGQSAHDSRIRCDLVDLYLTLYGRRRPACVPIPDLGMVLNLKERKTVLSDAAMATLESDKLQTPPEKVVLLIDAEMNNPEMPIQELVKSPAMKAESLEEPMGIGRVQTLLGGQSPPLQKQPTDEIEESSATTSGSSKDPLAEEEKEAHHSKKKKKHHKHKHHKRKRHSDTEPTHEKA